MPTGWRPESLQRLPSDFIWGFIGDNFRLRGGPFIAWANHDLPGDRMASLLHWEGQCRAGQTLRTLPKPKIVVQKGLKLARQLLGCEVSHFEAGCCRGQALATRRGLFRAFQPSKSPKPGQTQGHTSTRLECSVLGCEGGTPV